MVSSTDLVPMKRRTAIQQVAKATASGLALTACSRSQPKPDSQLTASKPEPVRWRLATSWPKSLNVMFSTSELFCRTLSILTEGNFVITPYESDELAPGLEVLDAVISGDVECGHTSGHYYLSKEPALAFSAGLPFGMTVQQQSAWLLKGGGLEALRQVYANLGVINFSAGSTGTQMGGWFNREITSVAELKGLRMRIPGLGGEIMSRLGVEVKSLAADKIVAALSANELDAVEFIGPYDDEKLGLNRVARYYYYPGWWSPSETFELIVQLDLWEQLPSHYQAAFQSAAALANQHMLARYNAENGKALKRLQSSGTETKAFSDEILQVAQSLSNELYAETAADSASFAQIYDSWQQFRQQIQQWHDINELSFVEFTYSSLQLS